MENFLSTYGVLFVPVVLVVYLLLITRKRRESFSVVAGDKQRLVVVTPKELGIGEPFNEDSLGDLYEKAVQKGLRPVPEKVSKAFPYQNHQYYGGEWDGVLLFIGVNPDEYPDQTALRYMSMNETGTLFTAGLLQVRDKVPPDSRWLWIK